MFQLRVSAGCIITYTTTTCVCMAWDRLKFLSLSGAMIIDGRFESCGKRGTRGLGQKKIYGIRSSARERERGS